MRARLPINEGLYREFQPCHSPDARCHGTAAGCSGAHDAGQLERPLDTIAAGGIEGFF